MKWSSIRAWLSLAILSMFVRTGLKPPRWLAAKIFVFRPSGSRSGAKPPSNWSDFHHLWPANRTPGRRIIRPLIAVCVVTAAIFALIEYRSPPVRYATAIGQTLTLTLSDGSRVILNTHTAITFKWDPNTPVVELQNGEILCDLVENPSRHLSVYVNGTRITDTGTTFTVRRTETGAVVVVRAGTVRVSGAHRPESEVVPNQEADVGSDDTTLINLSSEQVRRKLMWQFGRLEFQNDRLSDVIKEINRYSKIPIEVADPHLANVLVTGSLNPTDPINTFKELAPQLSWRVENNADGVPVLMLRKAR